MPEKLPIIIELEGGLVRDICNIPEGVEVEVWDYDNENYGEDDVEPDEKGEEFYRSKW